MEEIPRAENNRKFPQNRGKKTPKKITETYLRNAATAYLNRYAAGTSQFHKVMLRKIDRSCRAHPEQDRDACLKQLDALIRDFTEKGYLNDDAYLRGMVTSLRRRGLSRRAILAKLTTKGMGAEAVRTELDTYDRANNDADHDAEMAAALQLARRKRLGPYARSDQKEVPPEKALAAFARAGFSFDIARKILSIKSAYSPYSDTCVDQDIDF